MSELGDFSMEYDLKTPEQQAELANVVRFAIDRSRLTKEHCDFVVSLPMNGQVNSLNASVAAAIVIYEAVRQRTGS